MRPGRLTLSPGALEAHIAELAAEALHAGFAAANVAARFRLVADKLTKAEAAAKAAREEGL